LINQDAGVEKVVVVIVIVVGGLCLLAASKLCEAKGLEDKHLVGRIAQTLRRYILPVLFFSGMMMMRGSRRMRSAAEDVCHTLLQRRHSLTAWTVANHEELLAGRKKAF
jgi:hypothetical protein